MACPPVKIFEGIGREAPLFVTNPKLSLGLWSNESEFDAV